MPKALFTALILSITFQGFAQTYILQEDFNGGIPSTWAVVNADGATPNSAVNQFTNGFISYINNADTVAASTSYHETSGTPSADYLITPKLNLLTVSKLVWDARSVDASYPDGYYVLISSTDSLITSFTDTLMVVNQENYIWNKKSIFLNDSGYANQTVYIAFRNFTTDGFILMLDNVSVEVSDFVSAPEIAADIDFAFYPNPAKTQVSIQCSSEFEASIFSMNGQRLIQSNSNTIDVSCLAKGVYIIQLNSLGKSTKKRLVIE
jgi:hypothetical protein